MREKIKHLENNVSPLLLILISLLIAACKHSKFGTTVNHSATPSQTTIIVETPNTVSHSTLSPTMEQNLTAITRILFIGNSLTFYNDLPEVFAELSRSDGRPVLVETAAQGGWTLEDHAASSQTLDLIANADWDYVVLQEQSRRPAILENRRNQMIPAVHMLDEVITESGAVTVLFMTWGNREGLPEAGYPDYLSMQAGLQAGYLEVAEAVDALVVPVGTAWEQTTREDLALNLWQPDGIHPSEAGTYLAACVFYAWFFHSSPEGLDYPPGLSADTAAVLQAIAAQTILEE